MSVYRVAKLANKQHRFKVKVNAEVRAAATSWC